MKTSHLIGIGIAGLALFALLKNNVLANPEQSKEAVEYPINAGYIPPEQETLNSSQKEAVNLFSDTPINTPESIKAGIEVINTGASSRQSKFLANAGYNSTIGVVGGKVKQVTVTSAPVGNDGKTALDRIIEKNKALLNR